MNDLYGLQDRLAQDKLEVSSYITYNKKYRTGLSPAAKLMYQHILKRFSLTTMKYVEALEEGTMGDFTFIDENDKLFCYVPNEELTFVLNVSEPTVIKCKKELRDLGLLVEVKQTIFKTNRLYLRKIEMDLAIKKEYDEELKQHKQRKSDEKKKKNAKREFPRKEKIAPVIEEVKQAQKTLRTLGRVVTLKKLSSLNLKKASSLNLKKTSHITKEHVSTEELGSTTEINIPNALTSFKNFEREIKEYIYIDAGVQEWITKNEKLFTDKPVDYPVLVNWIKVNHESYTYQELCVGMYQILTFAEPIGSLAGFLESTFANIETHVERFRKKADKKLDRELAKAKVLAVADSLDAKPTVKKVPFYNWLVERD